MNPKELHHISTCIEENTEKLDLLERTLAVEEKQKKRFEQMIKEKEKEKEEALRRQLYEGSTASMSSSSILDKEDDQRKALMDALVRESSSNAPVVKVLTNIQGNNPAATYFI